MLILQIRSAEVILVQSGVDVAFIGQKFHGLADLALVKIARHFGDDLIDAGSAFRGGTLCLDVVEDLVLHGCQALYCHGGRGGRVRRVHGTRDDGSTATRRHHLMQHLTEGRQKSSGAQLSER